MKSLFCYVLFLCLSTTLYAQTGRISGRVTDASTQAPLPFANVYVNNTTIGVLTNDAGEFILPALPTGTTELVFSFIGYSPRQLKLTVRETGNTPLAIQLQPDARQVSEVQVKAGRDKLWEKQLRRFERVFLGNTSACTILNPWVIDFANEQNLTTATARIPLEIENKSLGYTLFFQLKKADYSSTQFAIVGTTRFTELETTDKSMALTWMKNRERAYHGSVKHLMKSILDKEINRQGFMLYKDNVPGKPRSRSFGAELSHNLLPYDTAAILTPNAVAQVYRIGITQRMEVHYTTEFTTSPFYQDVSNPVSWLETKSGSVFINQDGTLLNPTEVIISGSMADARVAGMLPLDYKPGSLVVVQSPQRFLARKLQENVYLHTDRPYYYPGERIWFSAYMNYRMPGLRDTLSTVLYVDLIGEDQLTTQHRILHIDAGRAAGAFSLPATIRPGPYVLRAYTQWDAQLRS